MSELNNQAEEIKSYQELKSEQKGKKPLSELAQKTRHDNALKAAQTKKQQKDQLQKEKEEQTIRINEQAKLLEDLKNKLEKQSDSEDSGDDEKTYKTKSKKKVNKNDDMTYIMETLRNIEKKTEKLYTLKKNKIRQPVQQQPMIINTSQPTKETQQSRQEYMNRMYKQSAMKL